MRNARVVAIREAGGPEVLELQERTLRAPGPHEVLVGVVAAGLNRADCLQRRGVYPAPPGAPADVPGLEFAGTVVELGEGVTEVKVGDRVMGICAGGGMSTLLLAHERELVPVPAAMSLEDAAAVPEVFFTAFDALFEQAGLRMGEIALLHAVASGVGTAALQLCLAVGATPVGTSRAEAKLARCRELGLVHGLHTEDGAFASRLREVAPGGADVVLDTIGGKYLEENIKALAIGGRMVSIGLLGGAKATLPLGLLLARRASVTGSVLRSRPIEEKLALTASFRRQVLPLFERKLLRPVVDVVVDMADIADAHRRMEADELFGKLVVRIA